MAPSNSREGVPFTSINRGVCLDRRAEVKTASRRGEDACLAVADLYCRFRRPIYRICRCLLLDRMAAEDATQIAFLRMCQGSVRSDGVGQAFSWLRRTAVNICLNELRRRRRLMAREAAGAGGSAPGHESEIATRVLFSQIAHGFAPEETAIAWLYHIFGFEQAEIAHVFGVSRRTVIARLNRYSQTARVLIEGEPSDAVPRTKRSRPMNRTALSPGLPRARRPLLAGSADPGGVTSAEQV
jgi:RNA polymerase sigma-70 factor (ECF subfamily)